MTTESIFRIAFWVLFGGFVVMAVTLASRVQRAGERVTADRQAIEREGWWYAPVRGAASLALIAFLVLYAINPPWLEGWTVRFPGWLRWAGVALGAAGVLLYGWSQAALGAGWSPHLQTRSGHHLVTSGPYARIRHPMYLATLGFLTGIALVTANWFFLALLAVSIVVLALRIPKEERMMIDDFGAEYRAYMQRTGRLLPRSGAAAPALRESRRRPVTEPNATNDGDCLWTNMIVGEVFPTAVTPATWSVWQDCFGKLSMGDAPAIGNIAGRPYLNYSLTYSFLLKVTRKHERVMGVIKDSIGVPPAGVEIPSFPVSWRTVLFGVLPREFGKELKKGKLIKDAPAYLARVRERCHELGRQIEAAPAAALPGFWVEELKPLWNEIHLLQDKTNEDLAALTRKLKSELTGLVGDEHASGLLTTISSAGELASLGPLLGLARVRRGELGRDEYVRRYGHRGPHENELAEPRPCESAAWIDRQLAELDETSVHVAELLARQEAESAAAWARVKAQLAPKQAEAVTRKVEAIRAANVVREATRSELTRLVSVIRGWFLRAGELARLGDDVFFLAVDEVIQVLSGDRSTVTQIPARREVHEAYGALPPLPAWIRGRLDPFQWAADPQRRLDVYDPHAPAPPAEEIVAAIIKGQPGSAGQVAGVVRRIDSPDEGEQLQPGEILVTSTTNVGWTPLFPRAAAVVTDVGGSLSHAAIVARELGIPAVVGCGHATIRLRTGDRVRVDGGRGTIEILEPATAR